MTHRINVGVRVGTYTIEFLSGSLNSLWVGTDVPAKQPSINVELATPQKLIVANSQKGIYIGMEVNYANPPVHGEYLKMRVTPTPGAHIDFCPLNGSSTTVAGVVTDLTYVTNSAGVLCLT